MSDYAELMYVIDTLHKSHEDVEICEVDKKDEMYGRFPFKSMYAGQKYAIGEVKKNRSVLLHPHTGAGKTAVFTTATRGEATIIIEPRKFLQKQVAKLFGDFVLYGRKEYRCNHAMNAGVAPCLAKVKCKDTYFQDECLNRTPRNSQPGLATCPNTANACKVFLVADCFKRYPCSNCAYIAAQNEAMSVLSASGTVVCNFGNFWNLLAHAQTVVVDEADLFFKEVSSPQVLHHTKLLLPNISKMLDDEMKAVREEMKNCGSGNVYRFQNLFYKLSFLRYNHELCFS